MYLYAFLCDNRYFTCFNVVILDDFVVRHTFPVTILVAYIKISTC